MDKPHILIVEDSRIAQVVLKNQMVQQGCTVDIASDGNTAIEQALATKYNLILMDIGLGEGPDGFEVSQSILSDGGLNSTTPIMAVTAHGEPHFEQKATEIGMVGYFTKPFNLDDAKVIMDFLKNLRS